MAEEAAKLRQSPLLTSPLDPDFLASIQGLAILNVAELQKLGESLSSGLAGIDKSPFGVLERRIAELRDSLARQAEAFKKEKDDAEAKGRQIAELKQTTENLRRQHAAQYLLSRVNEQAQRQLINSPWLLEEFQRDVVRNAFVIAVDIRRSTDLMLKARRPENYAAFIADLCGALAKIVTENYGVFDKFTGDGILAFFPEFYSGPDAAYYALTAADQCHKCFPATTANIAVHSHRS